jgi:hypothetical protein
MANSPTQPGWSTARVALLGVCGVVVVAMFAAVGMVGLGSVQAETRPTKDTKGGSIGFRLISSNPVPGYEKVTLPTDKSTAYVAPRPLFTGGDVVSTQVRDGSGIEFTLSPEATQRLTTLQGVDQLALYIDGNLAAVSKFATSGGRVTVLQLDSGYTDRVVKLLSGVRPAPTPIQASASINVIPVGTEDGLYIVDVFVEGVTSLRTYQVALTVNGGTAGMLTREDVDIDVARPDYVFADLDVIEAADKVGGRITSVLRDGIVDRAEPGYLGTYAFRPSSEATGTFEVAIDASAKTFLADSGNDMIPYHAGPAATFTIGQAPSRRTDGK